MATTRPRGATPFEIHPDEMEDVDDREQGLDESRAETEEGEDYESDASDATDEIVDPTVAEDIQKFEETFKGIKERFRLINRIGEGMYFMQITRCIN